MAAPSVTVCITYYSERELLRAKRDYALARYEYILNTLRLKHAAGTLNDDDLTQVNGWLQAR